MTGSAGDRQGRVEDGRLVRGGGTYSDDLRIAGELFGFFVRSPHAHARIAALDVAAARAAPGVTAVLTAADMRAAGISNVSTPPPLQGRGGRKLVVPHRPALADGRVMHVGQPVALVVAETRAAAQDAAEQVAVEYVPLPAVTAAEHALDATSPQLWPEAPGNLAVDWPGLADDPQNDAEVERLLAASACRVRVRAVNQRLAGSPLEPRSASAEFSSASGRYTLHAGSQGAGALAGQIAAVMAVDARLVRVLTRDVGGGFGLKTPAYPEYPALLVAARLAGRPVHWTDTRSDAFMSDNQGRDNVVEAELGLDADGRFLALRIASIANLGAFVSASGAQIATLNFARCFPTMYRIDRIGIGVRCVFTNTVPTGPYRGAGRPEANYVMERLVEAAARATGVDPVELRRRNLLPSAALPHTTPVGTTVDSGDFAAILDEALHRADWDGFARRRVEAAQRGKLRGIGLSCFLEHAGGMPTESADISFAGQQLRLKLAVQSSGQGHESVFRNLLARMLEVSAESIQVAQGDSDFALKGAPSVASRSAMTVSAAMSRAVDLLLAKGRHLAGQELEASEADIVFRGGAFEIDGTDRRIGLFDLAARAKARAEQGEDVVTLDTAATVDVPQSFPNGCHVAEVEIDPETGHVRVERYVAVDDCGHVLDHVLVEGQVMGGLAQGLGQALLERVVHDPESGQILTGTFNDYAMPRAEQMPRVELVDHPVPCRTNPLGVKGVGEAGTTGSIAAIMNAIADAIPGGRGVDLQMPATPEKVWRACRG